MKFILTNDDGIDAPGLEMLGGIMEKFGTAVTVGPKGPQSGVGHKVTARSPINVQKTNDHRYCVDGTPADCSRIGIKIIAPEADWVIAGINPGANLGSDVYNSGTAAAAREAAILGRKAIAISQYIAKGHEIDWDVTAYHAAPVIEMLLDRQLPRGWFWNVNLPHPLTYESKIMGIRCSLDTNPHKYEYRKEGDNYFYEGNIHDRPRDTGSDVTVCFGGNISITRISLDTKSQR